MEFGTGEYRYGVAEGWGQLPPGWAFGVVVGVACDSQDRVFVSSRSEHPLVVFDRDGNFLDSWGEGVLGGAHGLYVDAQDNVWCTVHSTHSIYKFNRYGELVLTLGTPGQPGEADGVPFNKPTDATVAATGEIFVTDGYKNACVHKYSADGQLLLSWGEHGSGPGQFEIPHSARFDRDERLWVCDRENRRIQIFDTHGQFLAEWNGLKRPCTLCFHPTEEVVYIAELEQRVGIFTMQGELVATWGSGEKSERLGEFLGGPHGICLDSHGDLYVTEALVEGRIHKYIRQR